MSMTRKQLKELGLGQEIIERLIQMHTETVEALKAERDTLKEAADSSSQLKNERDRLLEQVTSLEAERDGAVQAWEALQARDRQLESERQRKADEEALGSALLAMGANPQALPLLLRAADWNGYAAGDNGNGSENGGVQALALPLKERYGAFFSPPMKLCTELISPPQAPTLAMTREALQVMDAEEINRNWDAVKTALQEVNL